MTEAVSTLAQIRRVVTTHNAAGKSVVASDQKVALQGPPGLDQGAAMLWAAHATPSNAGEPKPAGIMFPEAGETAFFLIQHPPAADLENLPPELYAAATSSPADHVPGLVKGDTSRHFAMHRSDTVDYGIVISGQISMILDDGEVTLHPGDTYVLRGGAHAWSNKGDVPALVASVVVGAVPLEGYS